VKAEGLQFELLAFLSYMAVSARGCLDEPKDYGPFRLVDAMSRLIAICQAANLSGEGWVELQAFIDANKLDVMDSTADFTAFLDEVVARVVVLLERV
jgi:hypothetical protein